MRVSYVQAVLHLEPAGHLRGQDGSKEEAYLDASLVQKVAISIINGLKSCGRVQESETQRRELERPTTSPHSEPPPPFSVPGFACWSSSESSELWYRGTSLIRNRLPLGP